jgi:hypothetical protein
MNNYITAIKLLSPNAVVAGVGSTLDTLVFQENPDNLTHEQIQAKIAELEAAEPLRLLRIERDRLIQQTDWWVLPDRTATPAQLAYRQALRDLPANSTPALDENGNLTGVEWPVYSEEA